MKISIVTLNYNGSEDTIKLLRSLKEQVDQDFEIIVVDNASEEADFKNLEKYYTTNQNLWRAALYRNGKNLGFSGGNNVGIRQALHPSTRSPRPEPLGAESRDEALGTKAGQETGSDWVILINNDTWVEKYFVERLKAVLGVKRGIVSLPMNEGDRTCYAGKVKWLSRPHRFHISDLNEAQKVKDIYAIGGGMVIHKDVFEKIGFLDEKYFLYFEDIDYSVRARKNNILIETTNTPVVHHSVSSTTKKLGRPLILRYHYRNAVYFNLKNGTWYIKLLVWPWSWLIVIKQLGKLVTRRDVEQSKAILAGVIDFYKNKMGKIKADVKASNDN